MQTNNHKIEDYDKVLDQTFGKQGTATRAKAEEDAYAFYLGQIIKTSRKNERMTQEELAKRIGTDKSYISRVEHGTTIPSVTTFYRMASALGLTINVTRATTPA